MTCRRSNNKSECGSPGRHCSVVDGLGAEIGVSTNKIHARGPVGLDGLVIYKWKLYGKGQIVADYTGEDARKFTHKKLR
jgi:hypothetical protein